MTIIVTVFDDDENINWDNNHKNVDNIDYNSNDKIDDNMNNNSIDKHDNNNKYDNYSDDLVIAKS